MAKTRSWSVKGIDGETRDLARDAARASGMTIGAWIDQAILSAKSGELPIVAPGNVTGHTPAAAPTNTRAMAEPELPMSQAPAERPGEAPPNYATPEVTPPDVTAPGQEVPAPAIKSNPQTVTDTDSASTTAEQDSNIGESISGESISGETPSGESPSRDFSAEPRPLAPPPARPSVLRYAVLGLLFAAILGGGGWLFVELSSPDQTPAPQKIADAAPAIEAPPPPPATSSTTTPLAQAPDGLPADLPDQTRKIIVEARAGNPEAQYDLGMLHLSDQLGQKSPEEAAKWFGRAAEQGVASAQFNLGVLYKRSEGVAQDDKQAFFWFQVAAEQNFPQAQHNLATAYAEGKGIATSYPKAAAWFEKSAEAGLSQSQFSLGALHERGLITGQPNPAEARRWYERALAQGDTRASERLAALDAMAPPAAVAPMKPPPAIPKIATIGRTEIRQIQALLNRMNFNPGPADGQMGKRTADAIRLYQKFAGMEEDGVPSQELLEDLRAVAGSMSKDG